MQTETDVAPTERRLPGYVVALWVLVAAFWLIALARSLAIGIWFRDPNDAYVFTRMEISLAILAGCGLIDALWRARPRTANGVWQALRERWPLRRLLLVLTGLLGYHLIYWTYHNLKSWDVFLAPHDDLLHRFDRWLFFGHTPAKLLHDLLGTGVADTVLVAIYQSFSAVIMFAVVAFVAFAPTLRHAYAGLIAMSWTWILGVASYYSIPSLGPFASDPVTFARLPHTSVTTSQAHLLQGRQFLLDHPHVRTAFAEISAFASLHTGVTAAVVFLLWYFGFRRLSAILAVFLVLVMVATIYLGYHFISDDIAGLLIGFVAVRFGIAMAFGRERGAVAWSRKS